MATLCLLTDLSNVSKALPREFALLLQPIITRLEVASAGLDNGRQPHEAYEILNDQEWANLNSHLSIAGLPEWTCVPRRKCTLKLLCTAMGRSRSSAQSSEINKNIETVAENLIEAALEGPTDERIWAILRDRHCVFGGCWKQADDTIVEACESILRTGADLRSNMPNKAIIATANPRSGVRSKNDEINL